MKDLSMAEQAIALEMRVAKNRAIKELQSLIDEATTAVNRLQSGDHPYYTFAACRKSYHFDSGLRV